MEKILLLLALFGLARLGSAIEALPFDDADLDWADWPTDDATPPVNRMENDEKEEDRHRRRGPRRGGRHDVPSNRPNIFFLFLDDWGWNDVGYHNTEIFTPHIDQLAREGLRLEQNYVLAFCTPSRSALMTGMDPFHIGRQNFVFRSTSLSGLTLDYDIMPQYLKGLNYSTHIVGKWHLGHCNKAYLPTSRGFDTQYGIQNSGGYNEPHLDYVPPHAYDFFENDELKKDFPTRVGWQMDLYRDRIYSLINEQAAKGPDADPMFMYLAYTSSHFPVEAPFEYMQLYANVDDSEKRQSFMAMTSHMDNVIGNMTQQLKDNGMYDNSIIILMGDNGAYSDKWDWIPWYGGGSNLPLRGQKSNFYEGGTRVPAVVASPLLPSWKQGMVTNQMVHITDWLPTIITAAGGDLEDYPELADIDGKNQYSTIFGHNWRPVRRSFVYNMRLLNIPVPQPDNTTVFYPFVMGAIRYGRWKLLNFNDVFPLQPLGSFELYDLYSDPNETTNVWNENPVVANYLVAKWQEAANTMVNEDTTGFVDEADQLVILTPGGDLRTDFCFLDGTINGTVASDCTAGSVPT